jgi:hypothetical protein
MERQLTGPMRVARDAQVPGAPHVDTELDAVVALQLRDVADQLQLLFVLVERAVAPVHAKAGAELEGTRLARAIAADESGRQA